MVVLMSSKTEFKCDFCGNHLVAKGTNPDKVGWCLSTDTVNKIEFTNNLHRKLNGPHICEDCVEHLAKAMRLIPTDG